LASDEDLCGDEVDDPAEYPASGDKWLGVVAEGADAGGSERNLARSRSWTRMPEVTARKVRAHFRIILFWCWVWR
jgi:hypothetical protein